MIEIELNAYYNRPEYYRFMPKSVFLALEYAYISGSLTAEVQNEDFTKMILLKQINEKPQLQ
jgi:hypothetical protein